MHTNTHTFYESSCNDINFDEYLLLGGGTDINPLLCYNEERISQSQFPNTRRDQINISQFNQAVREGKPIFGICRGMQFLDAMHKGRLFQHSVGHGSSADIEIDKETNLYINLHETIIAKNSKCHHQIVDVNCTTGEVLGWSFNGNRPIKVWENETKTKSIDAIPEIMYWKDTRSLGVQFHPEWHLPTHPMNVFLRSLIKDLFNLEKVL